MPSPEHTHLAAVMLPAVWLGFVLAISFMEAPLKFRAPGVSQRDALAIGRLVFRALARVELVLCIAEGFLLWAVGWPVQARAWFIALAIVLVFQQAWVLPRLGRRTAAVLAGQPVSPGRPLHKLYVAGECAKVVVLPTLGWSLARALPMAGV